jgi:hypothetical protein
VYESTRIINYGFYRPEEVTQEPANYAGLGSVPKYYQMAWKPFYLWEQMYWREPQIAPWNILEPVMWRITDINKGQTVQQQPVFGQPMTFTPPDIAQLKE